jgi:hypothetical protein
VSLFTSKVERMTPGQVLADSSVTEFVATMSTAIATAQQSLDRNAMAMAVELAQTKTEFSGKSLLELGLTPTFYSVVEAELEVKMTLSMRVEQEVGIEIGLNVGNQGQGGNSTDEDWTVQVGTPAAGDTLTVDVSGQATVFTAGTATPNPFAIGANAGETAENLETAVNAVLTQITVARSTDPLTLTLPTGSTVTAGGALGTVTAPTPPAQSGNALPQPKPKKQAVAWGVSVNAQYHRRYEMEVSGSSRVTWKIVSLPAPTPFIEELQASVAEASGGSAGV